MEDDKIKELFAGFAPELSSENHFLSRLERNMNSVELIKRHNAKINASYKKALLAAVLVGFMAGFLCSLCLPYLKGVVTDWQATLSKESPLYILADNWMTIAWIAMGLIALVVTLGTFEVTSNQLQSKEGYMKCAECQDVL